MAEGVDRRRLTPVHVITNDSQFHEVLKNNYGIYYQIGSEDYTEQEGEHYHLYIEWPTKPESRRLSPVKDTAVRAARKHIIWQNNNPVRCICWGKGYNYACAGCGKFYKFIWLQSTEHVENCKQYITRKIDQHPEWDLDYQGAVQAAHQDQLAQAANGQA